VIPRRAVAARECVEGPAAAIFAGPLPHRACRGPISPRASDSGCPFTADMGASCCQQGQPVISEIDISKTEAPMSGDKVDVSKTEAQKKRSSIRRPSDASSDGRRKSVNIKNSEGLPEVARGRVRKPTGFLFKKEMPPPSDDEEDDEDGA